MTIRVCEDDIEVLVPDDHVPLVDHFRLACAQHLPDGAVPIRFAVTSSSLTSYQCEVGQISGTPFSAFSQVAPLFEFRRRVGHDSRDFNVVLLVPTGIGAEIGGHAGDAGPVARLMSEVADTLILHPNVVNASDINEMPTNSLYVEGSVITRLLMGTIGLEPVRSNRLLVVIDDHNDKLFVNAAINAVNGARAAYGLVVSEVVCLKPPVALRAHFAPSGRAAGTIEEIAALFDLLDNRTGQYDAVALSSVIDVPRAFHQGYFDAAGTMVNPWGGVEAMLTHALASMYDLPAAHSPMFESREIANMDPGVVDPRMAAEAVSSTFLQCTLKGLHRSPRIVADPTAMMRPGVFTAADISCVVIPDGCLGLPTLAALDQGITVIAVQENRNVMRNDLAALPWGPGQFYRVSNYWECVGVIAALRAGIDPTAVRRPLAGSPVSRFHAAARAHESRRDLAATKEHLVSL